MSTASDNLTNALRDRRSGPVDLAIDAETRACLVAAVDELEDAEVQVITLHFGLGDQRPRQIPFIARRMRTTESMVVVILQTALAKLRESLDDD